MFSKMWSNINLYAVIFLVLPGNTYSCTLFTLYTSKETYLKSCHLDLLFSPDLKCEFFLTYEQLKCGEHVSHGASGSREVVVTTDTFW